MSSFFTLPASQRKRKRSQPLSSNPSRSTTTGKPHPRDDDSISGSDVSDDDIPQATANVDLSLSEEESEDEDEDPNAKRVRLAEQYLANTQREVLENDGFDAADVDQENLRRRMGERLKEDTAESKGKLYRWVADDLDWSGARRRTLPCPGVEKSFTGVAVAEGGKVVYAASKDLQVVKWEVPEPETQVPGTRGKSRKPRMVARTRGNKKEANTSHHYKPILSLAVSDDGKFIATGSADKTLIIWSPTLQPQKVFPQHRAEVTGLAFRRGTHQLFSASKDRTVKVWALNELAYVDTLFGHQDEVCDVAALAQEKCVSVGSRDRTARLWKVVEESQLVFRGGGAGIKLPPRWASSVGDNPDSGVELATVKGLAPYHEGSMDRVAMIDDETFVTGSDNGSISLWNIHKKKPVFTLPLAHGVDPALPLDQASAELHLPSATGQPDDENGRGGRPPRWITALRALPFSDVVVSGSWEGCVRAWRISRDKRRLEALGPLAQIVDSTVTPAEAEVQALLASEGLTADVVTKSALEAMERGVATQQRQRIGRQDTGRVEGVVNDLAIVERGERGKEGLVVAAAVGREHRLGRWKEVPEGVNRVVLFEVPRKLADREVESGGDDE